MKNFEIIQANEAYKGETIKTINKVELYNLLANNNKANFISVQIFNEESKSKTINKAKALVFRGFYVAQTGVDYYTKVNRRLDDDKKITDDEKKETYYTKINNSLATYTKDYNDKDKSVEDSKHYLIIQLESRNQCTKVYYNQAGEEVDKSELENYFTPSGWRTYIGENVVTSGQNRLETENNFYHLVLAFENIQFLKLNKQVYKIEF